MKKWMKQILAMILVFGLAFSNLLTTVAEAADDYTQEAVASDFKLTHDDSKYTITGSVANLSTLPPEHMYLRFYDGSGGRVGEVQLTTYEFVYDAANYTMTFYGSDMVNTSNVTSGVSGSVIPAGDYKVALCAAKSDGTSAGCYQVNGGTAFSFNENPLPSRDYTKPNSDATDTVTGSDITVQVSDPYFSAYTDPTTVIRNHTMTVTASSAAGKTLTYQWYREGERIDGATSSSYTIAEYAMYSENHNMRYYCAVSNGVDTVYCPNFRFHYQGVNEVNAQFDGNGGTFDFRHRGNTTWEEDTTDEGNGVVADSSTSIADSGYGLTDAVWPDGTKTFKGWILYTYQLVGEQNGQPIVNKVPVGNGALMTTADVLAYKPDRDLDPLLFVAQWDDGTVAVPTYAGAVQDAFRTSYNGNNQSGTYTIEARGNYVIDLSNSGICFTLYDYTDGTWITDLTIDPNQYSLSADGKTFTFSSDALSSDGVAISEGLYKVGISLFEQTDPVTITRYAAGDGVHVKSFAGNGSGEGGEGDANKIEVAIWGQGGNFVVTTPDGGEGAWSEWRSHIDAGTSLSGNSIGVTVPTYWDPGRTLDKWEVCGWGTVSDDEGNTWEDWVPNGTLLTHEEMLAYVPTGNVLFKAVWSGDDADYQSQVIYDAFGGSIAFEGADGSRWETNWFENTCWSDGSTVEFQHGFVIDGDPTADDQSFEGWLEFIWDGEQWNLVSVDAENDYSLLTTAEVLGAPVSQSDVKYVVKWSEIDISEYLNSTGGDGGNEGGEGEGGEGEPVNEVNVQYQGRGQYFDFTHPGENGTTVTETVKDWGFGVPVGETVFSAGYGVTDVAWPDNNRTFEGWLVYGIPDEGSDQMLLNDGVPMATADTMNILMTDAYMTIIFEAFWSGDDFDYGSEVYVDMFGGTVTIQQGDWQETVEGFGAFSWTDNTTFFRQNSIVMTGEPVREGMTFEGWLEFGLINDEWVLMAADTEGYTVYTTNELLTKVVPEYDVRYVAKWAELPIEEYLSGDDGEAIEEYIFFLDGAGGLITISGRNEGTLITEVYPFLDLYTEEGYSIAETAADGGTTELILEASKEFSSFIGWKVFEADEYEVAAVPAGTTVEIEDENVTLIYIGEYDGNDIYCAYLNMKQVKTGMTTEELLNMKSDGKHYYALAQYKDTFVEVEIESDKAHRLDMTENDVKISEDLYGQEEGKFETKEEVKEALKEAAEDALKEIAPETGDDQERQPEVLFMEITLKVKQGDGSWEVVTGENFPDEGLEIVIPYPEGVDKDQFCFVIAHLISAGSRVGEIETFGEGEAFDSDHRYEKTAEGLKIKVFSLSPFAVMYREIETGNSGNGENAGGNSGGDNADGDIGNSGGADGSDDAGTMAPVEGTDTGDHTSIFSLMMAMLCCAVMAVIGNRKLRRA